jgi:stringent starvation protein B
MTSSRPYFIRALYDWIVDNSLTPYLVVHAASDGVEVPQEFVNKDGQILLNIAPRAVMEFSLTNEGIMFKARFGGIPREIYVPSYAVLGVYARENGQGMMFDPELPSSEPPPSKPTTKGRKTESVPSPNKPKTDSRPSLRVVK